MSLPFWVHCNICSEQFSKTLKLYMLNCSHTVCKNCFVSSNADGAEICPLCKKTVKVADVTKIPNVMKALFGPEITNALKKPMKMIGFQRSQQLSLFKLARDSKLKNKKIIQVKAQLEKEIRQMKKQHDAMVERRQAMQQKLLQIYERNQQKKEMVYRNPAQITTSSSFSLASRPSSLISSPSMNQSGQRFFSPSSSGRSGQSPSFFSKNAPMFNVAKTPTYHSAASTSSRSSGSGFNSLLSVKSNKSSQSSRKPFFA